MYNVGIWSQQQELVTTIRPKTQKKGHDFRKQKKNQIEKDNFIWKPEGRESCQSAPFSSSSRAKSKVEIGQE